jgi:oligopeptide/dipeptide ABC transporter ATP-binding protein
VSVEIDPRVPSTTDAPPEAPLLSISGLRVDYLLRRSMLARGPAPMLRAVDGVDLVIARGETFGLVGESGCGKSTLARAIVGLQVPSAGELRFDGQRIDRPRPAWVPRRIQIVFQDPYSSLNPRLTVSQTLGEMLHVHRMVPRDRIATRVDELLELVGLGRGVRSAYPRQLSGGQRQRVGIARALSLEPELLVADEPVSALDVSVQATILALLEDLRARLGLTLLLIAHDLAVVRQVCDRVAVMYLGRIVEEGHSDEVFGAPRHPYTQALLRAVPSLHPGRRDDRVAAPGEPPSPFAVPSGCRFHPRCPIAHERCRHDDPGLTADPATDLHDGHRAACHFAWRPPQPADGLSMTLSDDPIPDAGTMSDPGGDPDVRA